MVARPEATQPTVELALVDLLSFVQRSLVRELGAVLAEESVSVDQWRILRALDADIGHQMGELAVSLEIPHPTLTRLVDGLVDSAYLYRTQSAEDRRRVAVQLSNRGRALLRRLNAMAAAHEDSVRDRSDEQLVTSLLTGLDTMRGTL